MIDLVRVENVKLLLLAIVQFELPVEASEVERFSGMGLAPIKPLFVGESIGVPKLNMGPVPPVGVVGK